MANCMVFHTQIASVMEVLANAAVAEICKLVDDDYAEFRLEISQSQKENRTLRRKLQLLELKVSRERILPSRPSSVKILDRYRSIARGEGHLPGGHSSVVKPTVQNRWRDDQPITVDEGSGTATQHVIVIEVSVIVLHKKDLLCNSNVASLFQKGSPQLFTCWHGHPYLSAIGELVRFHYDIIKFLRVSGTQNTVLKSETDTKTLAVLEQLGCPPPTRSEYLLHGNLSPRTVLSHRDSGDALQTGNDPSCSYVTEMIPGDMPVGLDKQTNAMRGDWNQYSSSVYSEGCLDKKGEGLVLDEMTVKVEGDAPLTWNPDETHLGEQHSQGNTGEFLDYGESLETNLNVATHSALHMLRECEPVSKLMGPCDSHGRVLFDQVLKSNDRARAQGGAAASGNSKAKRFLCMFCNKGFSCIQKVEMHQRVHTGEKPFSCTQCHMRFAEAGNLKRHQRVHTGEKPFSCHLCRVSFSHSFNLKRHQRVHTGENPAPSVRRGSPTSTS
uniref:C2H2-type domain-containing protein n=1 Tax=Oncorhynchus tshawytscha TaxID=74940 RepID=A0AAZ3QG27_ONCTS